MDIAYWPSPGLYTSICMFVKWEFDQMPCGFQNKIIPIGKPVVALLEASWQERTELIRGDSYKGGKSLNLNQPQVS